MSLSLVEVLLFIASAEPFDARRIRNASNRRIREFPNPNYSLSEARRLFPLGSVIEIADSKNDALNGVIAKVVKIERAGLIYEVAGQTARIDVRCAVPVTGEEAEAFLRQAGNSEPTSAAIVERSARVKLAPNKQFGEAIGIIVRVNAVRFTIVIVEGEHAGEVIKAPHLAVSAIATIQNPKLRVLFKNEIEGPDPAGPVKIVDTEQVGDGPRRQKFGEKVDGILEVAGYLRLSEARALAKGLGAEFEE